MVNNRDPVPIYHRIPGSMWAQSYSTAKHRLIGQCYQLRHLKLTISEEIKCKPLHILC